MAKTSKNNIYYNDDENSIADVLSDMKELAESTDDAIENAKYDDKQIKQNISNIEKKNTEQGENITNNTKSIEELKTENEILKAENKLIKEQIPSSSTSGNSIHIEDSGSLDFDWKIRGGHAQTITTQPENYVDDREARGKTILEATSLYLPIVNLKAGSGYYFKIFDSNDKIKNDSRYLAVEFYDISKTKIQSDALGYPNTFTEENVNKIKFAKIYYNKNDTDKVIGNTVIKKIGLKITSSASADDIDMFVPDSPSLDYPSVIKTVGSNVNELNIADVEEKEVNGVKYSVKDGVLRLNGTATEGIDITLIKNVILKKGIYTHSTSYMQAGMFASFDNKNGLNGSNNITKNTFELTDDTTYSRYFMWINKGTILNNVEQKLKLEKGSTETPYSHPGMGSVEIDVVNKNFYKASEKWFNNIGGAGLTVSERSNKECTLTTTQRAYTWFGSNQIGGSQEYRTKVKENTKYTFSFKAELLKGTAGIGLFIFFDRNLTSEYFEEKHKDYSSNITFVTPAGTNYIHFRIDIYNANTAYRISEIKIEAEDGTDKYEKHQSQTAIMPIQQEMLSGDYIADVEHHEWGKLVLTGNEKFVQAQNANKLNYFYLVLNSVKLRGKMISNMLKSIKSGAIWDETSYDDIVSSSLHNKIITIMLSDTTITTLEQFKEKLKELYNAGTPIIIYYELAEPINLELTEEQKAIRDTKLYTYKNITNIDVSDELASIDVTYKKDLETEHNKLQNQIDEIKQLISTTETSALLLDNLQKDVEMEVE